ncbi:hypothetical protein [Mycoplasma phocoenae]|uniref:Uncharacterized protein n=1 Tax=Mycoplasma phocoenae TaxID=754517 RepID=A0A858U816_9MOLU|nr:hypothetical protein [Mycoplasma phocoenae]QJG66876.1 hypothetical protein HGG69_00855 [Mycoplasma phocoenae]
MDLTQKIKAKYSNIVNKCSWEVIEGNKILSIEINVHNFDEVQNWTNDINGFIDGEGDFGEYCLDIHSQGCDIELKYEDLNGYIDQKIRLFLNKPYNEEYEIVIKFLENRTNELYGIKNNKGRMQKITIAKENIKKIEKELF